MTSDRCDYMVCPPTLETPEERCDEPTELGERYCTYHLDLTDD